MKILESAKVNDVVAVRYGDDHPEERVGRILGVRDLRAEPLHPDTVRRRPDVKRTDFLLNIQFVGGEVRSMYAGNETNSRKVHPLRRAWLTIRGKLPRKVVVS